MWQPRWEGSCGKNGYMYIYGWVPLPSTLNGDNVVCMCVWPCSVVSNSLVTPWTLACQAPLSLGFPRQEYWSELSFPSLKPELLDWDITYEVLSEKICYLTTNWQKIQRQRKMLKETASIKSESPECVNYRINDQDFPFLLSIQKCLKSSLWTTWRGHKEEESL